MDYPVYIKIPYHFNPMKEQSVTVSARISTRSPVNRIESSGGKLLIRVKASPVDNQANRAVIEVIADALGTAKKSVEIIAGLHSRNKVLRINGISEETLLQLLSKIP